MLDAVLLTLPLCGLPRIWEDSPLSFRLIRKVFLLGLVASKVLILTSASLIPVPLLCLAACVDFASALSATLLLDLVVLNRGQQPHVSAEHFLSIGLFRS